MFVQIFKTNAAKQYEELQNTKLIEVGTCFETRGPLALKPSPETDVLCTEYK